MPRYRYHCEACEKEIVIFHRINDIVTKCPQCESETIEKMLSVPVVINKDRNQSSQVGKITHEYIEANKEILKNQKKEAEKQNYE